MQAAVTEHSLRRDLATLRDLWPLLLDPAKRPPTSNHGPTGSRPPLPVGAASIRRELPEVLTSWVRLCMDDFGADPSGLDATDGAALTRWLDPWCAQLAEHEAAADLAAELEDWLVRVEACTNGPKRRRVALATACPVIEDGLPCPGVLVAVARYDEPGESRVACSVAGHHSWAVADWTDLGHLLRPGGVALVSVKEASALAGVPVNTIKSWLRRERVQRYPGPGDESTRVDYREVLRARAATPVAS